MSRAGRDKGGLPAAPAATDADLPPPPSPRAMELVTRFKALRSLTMRMMQTLEAGCMETAWSLRREFPSGDEGDVAFGAFAQAHIGLEANTALRMAATWTVARKQRPLRELADVSPNQVMSLVQQFADGSLLDDLRDDDPRIVQLLSLPPRRRREELGLLIEARDGERHPDDVRRIRELEERAAGRDDDPRAGVNRAREAIVALSGMADRLREVEHAIDGVRLSEKVRRGLLDEMDRLQGAAEAITESLMEQR